eukprot:CAMPEP_0170640930 /NCGR_PEP_ID=MMETSP0224-20130122/40492_1 /TAXON_ID=285029 /ORGANISM="Togula jolla, Strain CCCM 725" /LENGTH=45 /DNA_ID= /DNA_START= /DNA_END= /DNA_ORIENTATION=
MECLFRCTASLASLANVESLLVPLTWLLTSFANSEPLPMTSFTLA